MPQDGEFPLDLDTFEYRAPDPASAGAEEIPETAEAEEAHPDDEIVNSIDDNDRQPIAAEEAESC